MTTCHYTPDYIDNRMTLPRLAALMKHWAKVPPLTVSVGAIATALGMKRDDTPGTAPAARDGTVSVDAARAKGELQNAGIMTAGGLIR